MSTECLNVNANLINSKFESYRLCSDHDLFRIESISLLSLQEESSLTNSDDCRCQLFQLGENDFSYVQFSMASSINNLVCDKFKNDRIYLINRKGHVLLGIIDDQRKQMRLKKVFEIPGLFFENLCLSNNL